MAKAKGHVGVSCPAIGPAITGAAGPLPLLINLLCLHDVQHNKPNLVTVAACLRLQ